MSATPPYRRADFDAIEFAREGRAIASRQWKRMLCFFCGMMALIVIALIICPRKYISEAKIFVRVGRESIGLDPTATTGQTMALHESRENEIASVLDILGSRVVLERVVDELGPDVILDGDAAVVDAADSDADTASSKKTPDPLKREKAIRHLDDKIKKVRSKKSNVATISYRDRTPAAAQQVLETFLKEFQAIHIRANRTSGSFEFFDEQTELLREQFADASRKLNQAKDAINAVSIDQRRASLQEHLSQVETAMLITQADLDSTQAAIVALEQTLEELPAKALTEEVTGLPDDALGTTRKRLHELELREQELLTRYTANHPSVQEARRQADLARTILDTRDDGPAQATNADNPTYQSLKLRKLERASEADALQAKLASLKNQFDELATQLRSLNEGETEIVQLQQRTDLLLNQYKTYSEKREQARIDHALEAEQISNVNVVQPPTFVAKPVSPRKGLTLAFGFLFASAGAVCLAVLTDYGQRPRNAPQNAYARPATNEPQHDPPRTTEDIGDDVSNLDRMLQQAQS